MAQNDSLVSPKALPALNIPESSSTVTVRVIDSTTRITMPRSFMMVPDIKGHENFHGPSYAFLVSNGEHHVLFDLGTRQDLSKGAPAVLRRINKAGWDVRTDKDVAEILDDKATQTGISSKNIEAVIFSHHHWDHTGNLGLFPASTDLVVGPGFKKEYLPGYPTDPKSSLYEPDFENRNIRGLEMETHDLKLGRCEAWDYFKDGSFYLISTPGHSVGHICGLARVSASPSTFILMGGDALHHAGEFRPSEYLPLPKIIKPSPFPRFRPGGCPGELLEKIHPEKKADQSFYKPAPGFNFDDQETERSIAKLQEFDGDEHIFTLIAHDEALLGHIPLFPDTINDWYAHGLDAKTRWNFTKDFEESVGNSKGGL